MLVADRIAAKGIFASVPREKVDKFAAVGEFCDVQAGEHIFRLGERADYLYFLDEGTVDLTFVDVPKIFNRLSALASAARSLGAGKLHHRVEIEGNDQITVLGTEFNKMADSLTRLLAEVRREQTRLENIMNGVGDSLFVLDRDLRIVAANEAFS